MSIFTDLVASRKGPKHLRFRVRVHGIGFSGILARTVMVL